ncbi:MAG TPA: protein-L-isoaspartate(D-aspartate) O-methyltransferase [Stellaceae bacterium]|nr:protein-L-isoaspartate(D-aspartate) O-methyltransferase [Stellaceae bacterium]
MIEESAQLARMLRLIMELRRAGIGDARVLGAIEKMPREMFVGESLEDRAYDNVALPIGSEQTISQPYVVGLMTEKLVLTGREKVLEIGTGSGYQAAILSRLARRVFTIERHRALMREAERRFAALRLGNIVTLFGDGAKGWREQAPFDRIIVTAAVREVPGVLVEQLGPEGLMVLPVGAEHEDQRLVLVRRHDPASESGYEVEELAFVRFVPLVPGLPRGGDEIAEPHDDLAPEEFTLE